MIGIMLEHDFMIKKRICDTFVLTKRGFSGSGQMLLNTLLLHVPISGSMLCVCLYWGCGGEHKIDTRNEELSSCR